MQPLVVLQPNQPTSQRPPWLRVRAPTGENYKKLKTLMEEKRLHTVCSSASCPNMGECWELKTATFMILGNICTRACRFCDVNSYSRPKPVDPDEPNRLAETTMLLGLRHVVITSVTRDDLPDGGAFQFAKCLHAIRARDAGISLEVLTPDFLGKTELVDVVLEAMPDVFNHNVETVERLTPKIRSGGLYRRSLEVLRYVKQQAPMRRTKSGIMLGLGETDEEAKQTLADMRAHGVDILTIGQYLRPSAWHHPVDRYVHPDVFAKLKTFAYHLGFAHVESGPLVRSSYHAHKGAVAEMR